MNKLEAHFDTQPLQRTKVDWTRRTGDRGLPSTSCTRMQVITKVRNFQKAQYA